MVLASCLVCQTSWSSGKSTPQTLRSCPSTVVGWLRTTGKNLADDVNPSIEDSSPVRGLSGVPLRRPPSGTITFLFTDIEGSTQLWEVKADGRKLRQVTDVEGGIGNFRYSPDGTHISFTADVKLDRTVNDLYSDLPEADARIMDGLMYRHWDSWHDYAYSHLFVAPYKDGWIGEPVDLMPGLRVDTPLNPFGGVEHRRPDVDVGVVALYEAYDNKEAAGKACAVLSLVGMVNIPIIYKSVDWWYSLHQPASIKFTGESSIDSSMLYPLLLMIAVFYSLFACCLLPADVFSGRFV